MKIAFDVGGVLSKYPEPFKVLIRALVHIELHVPGTEVHVISDMHPVHKVLAMLEMNNLYLKSERVHSADYKQYGENCKAVLCAELGIDILVDDFPGYVATFGSPLVRLLVMPDPSLPYYAEDWKTDGSEGDFGRRNPPGSKRSPEGRPPEG
jgi:hypothetical protein